MTDQQVRASSNDETSGREGGPASQGAGATRLT